LRSQNWQGKVGEQGLQFWILWAIY
jgi:hypothetical protein